MSKTKRIIQIVLLLVVVGSVSYLIAKELFTVTKTTPLATTLDVNIKPDHIVAYYFHGNFRCTSCKKIEAYSKESIDSVFSNELKNSTLSFKVINVEEPENRHFVQDYGLYTKSLVIASYSGDKQIKYKNLEHVWDYLNSKEEFENYVKVELSRLLSEVRK